MIKIAIVDDDIKLLSSMKKKLSVNNELEVLFTATNEKELTGKLQSQLPDMLLMDIRMPRKSGIEITKKVRGLYPEIKIIMLTVLDSEEMLFESVMAGAIGYITKDATIEATIQAITDCAEGGAFMSPAMAMKALNFIKKSVEISTLKNSIEQNLSKRELEILDKLAQGKTYKQIGELLFISSNTVRKHIENIYAKLRVHNKMQAIGIAKKREIL